MKKYKKSEFFLFLLFIILLIISLMQNLFYQNYPKVTVCLIDSSDSAEIGAGNKINDSLVFEKNVIKNKTKQLTRGKKNININTASIKELCFIRGIGPRIAKRIVGFREKNGSFKIKEDLKKVKGIGEKKYQKIKDYVILK